MKFKKSLLFFLFSLFFLAFSSCVKEEKPSKEVKDFRPQPLKAQFESSPDGFIRNWVALGPVPFGRNEGDPFQRHPVNYEELKKMGQSDPTEKLYLKNEWKVAPSPGETVWVETYEPDPESSRLWRKMQAPQKYTWRPFESDTDRITLSRDVDYAFTYFVTYVYMENEVNDAAFYVGSDDFVSVVVNGETVHVYKAKRRGLNPYDEVTGVHLKKGWNIIRLKVVDVSHGYEFFFSMVDDKGNPLSGVPVSITPPEDLPFVSEERAKQSHQKMHDAAVPELPPSRKPYDPEEALGTFSGINVLFQCDKENIAPFKDQPLVVAVAGKDSVTVNWQLSISEDFASAVQDKDARLTVSAVLYRRDRRAEEGKITDDLAIEQQIASLPMWQKSFKGSPVTIESGEPGYYSVVVTVGVGDARIRLEEFPVAFVSPPDNQPRTFEETISSDWQEGDFFRYSDTVTNSKNPKRLKFWPVLEFPGSEVVSPVKPNFLTGRRNNLGLGFITPVSDRAPESHLILKEDWVTDHRTYLFTSNDGAEHQMVYHNSKASPAVLAVTGYNEMNLFAGLDRVGLEAPVRVAWMGENGPVSAFLSDDMPLQPKMNASWLLFWFEGTESWKSVDIPALVVLQHQPESITRSKSGIRLRFKEKAGHLAAMPLYGSRIITPKDTLDWATGIPQVVVDDCNFWAKALHAYPVSGRDYFRKVQNNIETRIDYEHVTFKDDWNTFALKLAPYPYWVGLVSKHPHPVVKVAKDALTTRTLHPYGPVTAQTGESAHFMIEDITKYIEETKVVLKTPSKDDFPKIYEDLEFINGEGRDSALSSMHNLGGEKRTWFHHFTSGREILKIGGGYKFGQHCFENENSMIANVSRSLPFLPEKRAQTLKALMMRFMEHGTSLYRYLSYSEGSLMYEDTQWFISRFLLGFAAYVESTGHYALAEDRFPLAEAEFASLAEKMDWDNLMNAGSEESNLLYQAGIGYSRLAKMAGNEKEYLYGMYFTAKNLALLQGVYVMLVPEGHQNQSWFISTPDKVNPAKEDSSPKRPALFYRWMMSQPIYSAYRKDTLYDAWHATVLSPFTYPYYPELFRFHEEKNRPLLSLYFSYWQENFPEWYKGLETYWPEQMTRKGKDGKPELRKNGWGVYFNSPEFIAARSGLLGFTGESARQLKNYYLQNIWWGEKSPRESGYEFNNRGWMSLPTALSGILEAAGETSWIRAY